MAVDFLKVGRERLIEKPLRQPSDAIGTTLVVLVVFGFAVAMGQDSPVPTRSDRRVAWFHIPNKAPDPAKLEEYYAFKASIDEDGWSEGRQRALDELGAKVVFPLYVSQKVLSPNSDGVELRKAVDQAERLYAAKIKINDIVPDGAGGFRYEPKKDLLVWQANERLFGKILKKSDRDWISPAQQKRLIDAVSQGEAGKQVLLRAERSIDNRRILENKWMKIKDITYREVTRQINAGEIPNYEHPDTRGVRRGIETWELDLD